MQFMPPRDPTRRIDAFQAEVMLGIEILSRTTDPQDYFSDEFRPSKSGKSKSKAAMVSDLLDLLKRDGAI